MLELEGQIKMEEMCFLKMGKDSAARIELGRSFHQMGTVNEKVCESDFVPLWDGTVMRRCRTQASRGHINLNYKSNYKLLWIKAYIALDI